MIPACTFRYCKSLRWGCLLLALSAVYGLCQRSAFAQQPDSLPRFAGPLDTLRLQPDTLEFNRFSVLPLPVVGYQPETNFFGGAAAFFNFRLSKDSLTRPSTANTGFAYSLNEQLVANLSFNLFTDHEAFNIRGFVGYRFFPEFFYGYGPRTSESLGELYSHKRWEGNLEVLHTLIPGEPLFVGPTYRFTRLFDVNYPANGLLASGVPGAEGYFASGGGIMVLLDQRKNLVNPKQGVMMLLRNTFNSDFFGSSHQFSFLEVDLRKYWQVWEARNWTLAAQARLLTTTGTPPFRNVPLLGSQMDMRGYYQGRYRDTEFYSFQTELRFPVVWRFGLAAWLGAGDVAPGLADFDFATIKPTAGTGIRFKIDRKNDANLRVDAGVGRNSVGLYFAYGEAF